MVNRKKGSREGRDKWERNCVEKGELGVMELILGKGIYVVVRRREGLKLGKENKTINERKGPECGVVSEESGSRKGRLN